MVNLAKALEKEGIAAFHFDFARNGYNTLIRMQDMGRKDHHSDTKLSVSERVAYSGPLSGPLNKRLRRKSVRFNIP
ncbi:unnamed protein product [Dovyalis caffra]|uniref:Uncharacterized protein n=1 Tax=Dovyalis caffra TaxID=77055 RepID=A0AAV1S3R5_9ROSI|nr:unnamed protein product [Dovyalis caffra]